jgi:secretion/DNA translocation related TadE-like protein
MVQWADGRAAVPALRGRRRRCSAGSATLYVLALAAALLAVSVVVTGFAGLTVAKHRAVTAADLAALAAASAAASAAATDSCAVATETARHNGARVTECVQEGSDVLVTVGVAAQAPFGLQPLVRARARAGPAR